MDKHSSFFARAKDQGLVWDGIAFAPIAGLGNGVKATRPLKTGDVVLTVPASTFRTLSTLSPRVVEALPDHMSLHGRLAADLSLDNTPEFAQWSALFPSISDLETALPFFWPKAIQELLPAPAKASLEAQTKRLNRDKTQVVRELPDIPPSTFTYYWMVVNSRSFYLPTPEMQALDFIDRLVLMPVADLFNHADAGCRTTFSPDGYQFAADRDYAEGEEVKICYGDHTNDFLLVEYGFVQRFSRWDKVFLDDVILPKLDVHRKTVLNRRKLLGSYEIGPEMLGCPRTQAVLRLLFCGRGQWEKFVRGNSDGKESQADANALLETLLAEYEELVNQRIETIAGVHDGLEAQRRVLMDRWKQIELVVSLTREALRAKI
ncbi:SET domain-containing protein [Pseudovirgaria hyperparasitica]|uniref:SET domain-containing protein n=1 Tax=Pseudovirgaria hyperparasitica TaxID=470096 RepID=A0A6A6VXF4_9PEZI|nr:SET domain-containing protein [Pseudovirgaria hyperparasitica]KAF2754310.1 SET domain-containing protein [Pseudovirgaria hyperparasitica]